MSSSLEHSRDRLLDGPATERLTYRERADVLEELDMLVEGGPYRNRSEAIRAATRQLVSAETRGEEGGE